VYGTKEKPCCEEQRTEEIENPKTRLGGEAQNFSLFSYGNQIIPYLRDSGKYMKNRKEIIINMLTEYVLLTLILSESNVNAVNTGNSHR